MLSKKPRNVQIQHPVIIPTMPPGLPHRIQCRPARTIPERVSVKEWLDLWFKLCLYHRLGDPIRNRRNPQLSFPSTSLRYLHRADRRWKVTARRHPIPQLVEVVFQVLLKLRNRLFVDSCCSLIRFDPLIRVPDFLLGNRERFCLTHRLLPFRVDRFIRLHSTAPRSIPLSRTSSLLRAIPPLSLRFRTLALVVLPLVASPLASKSQVPTFRFTASRQDQATFMPDAAPSVNRFRRS